MEIILAAIIFIISVGGVFATLNAVRSPVITKESALVAAVFGKQVLEALRSQVNDPQGALATYYNCSVAVAPCPDFSLSQGDHLVSVAKLNAAGISWPSVALSNQNLVGGVPMLSYTVTCADGVAAHCITNTDVAHMVTLNIKW